MLKGIPAIISPELLKILAEMGHGDEIVLGDANFPGQAINERCVRCDGHGAAELLNAILQLFPLDTYAKPVYLMEKVKGDNVETPIWEVYKEAVKPYTDDELEYIERYEFYERAKKAYAVVVTGETALYGNIILKKGVIAN
ncbi:MAG: L-fucose mutarotase [Clostridia bacterium]|nr:L-fucose mutarotase [Clostridia bacterium]